MERTVYTLGHSSHSDEHFLALLRTQQTDVLVDTRSSPHSKFASQFSQGPFKLTLRQAGMHLSVSRRIRGWQAGGEVFL